MKKKFIYLDWNVIKALKDHNCDLAFSAIIDELKSQYLLPFSFAQLCDRQKGLSIETAKFVKEDLDFLNHLSDGYMLGRYGDDFDISKKNIYEKYDEVTKARIFQYPNFKIPEEILNQVKQNGLKNFFANEKNIKWYRPLMFCALNRFNSDPELYRLYREVFKIDPPEELSFFSHLQNPNITSDELKAVVDHFIEFNHLDNNELRSKINIAYLLLDFNPHYHEKKITSKNNFTNIYTDSEHMLNASFAEYYITEDKKARNRTVFIYNAYSIGTKVFNIADFIEFFKSTFHDVP